MNRLAITQGAKDFLTEYKGDTAAESPHAWPLVVTQAANDVGWRTSSFWGSTVASLVPGVSDYPPLTVYAPRRVTVGDGNGNIIQIGPMSMDDLNVWGVVEGFVTATGAYTAGIPSQFIYLAATKIRLIPVPNYALQNGLTIEGLAYPAGIWPDDGDECPLPQEAHMAVMYRAAVLRTAQFPDPDNKARSDQMGAVYESELTGAKAAMAQTAQLRAQMDTAIPYVGGI